MSSKVSIHDAQPGWPWPVRPRPIDGEATFSYMVRAACANGYALYPVMTREAMAEVYVPSAWIEADG